MNAPATLPRKLGKYILTRQIGEGATSTVYLAEDSFSQREVAIKLFADKRRHGEGGTFCDTALRTEKALLGKLNHPHVVRIYDVVDDGDEHYVVMEYVAGGTMEPYTARGRLLEPEMVIDRVFKCGKALEYMHHLGLIHRDIKPANILVTENGDVRLTDLGATLVDSDGGTGDRVGTPVYMSPEQIDGHALDFRSDMFSLGVVLYELLTGEKPFAGNNIDTIGQGMLRAAPKPIGDIRPRIPKSLDRVVSRMLALSREVRYPSWEECLSDLMAVVPDFQTQEVEQPANLASSTERFRLLRACSFFEHFSDADLWYVLEIATLSHMVEGDTLIREGDAGDCFLVILSGKVRVSRGGRLIDIIGEGMSIGEISYVLDGRVARNTTCSTMQDGIVMRVDNDDLRNASEICRSRFEKTFLKMLASWLVDANDRLTKN